MRKRPKATVPDALPLDPGLGVEDTDISSGNRLQDELGRAIDRERGALSSYSILGALVVRAAMELDRYYRPIEDEEEV